MATTKLAHSPETHFAWMRTRMSVERTFMAWLRTAASMIGFGFTIVEFFARFAQIASVGPARAPRAPRLLGLMLIGTGVVALAFAFGQYVRLTRHLDSEDYAAVKTHHTPASPTMLLAIAIMLIGIFAFAAIVLRLH
jgi:putative membrane protein